AQSALDLGRVADPEATARGLISEVSAADANLLARVRANVARQHGEGIAWNQRAMSARPSRLDVLEAADVPAFVVRGEDDAVTSEADADAMAQALGVEVVSLPRVGHLAALEAPGPVADLIASL